MMKKILLALAIMAGTYTAKVNAQNLRLENISATNLSGLKMSPDQQTFCNVYAENTSGENETLNIAFYNEQFIEIKKVPFDMARGTSLLASAFSGEVTAIFLANSEKKTRTILTVDRHGNIMQKKEEENVTAMLLNPGSYTGLYPVTPTEFVSVIATSPKSCEIQRFSMMLDPGEKIVVKSDNKMTIEETHILNDVVFLSCKESIGVNNDKIVYSVKAVNLAENKIAYSAIFGENTMSGLPTKMKVNDDMTVDLFGLLFNEGDMDKTPDGIVWVRLDHKGDKIKYVLKQWPELLEQSKDKTLKDLASGKLDILIEDMFKMAGTENLVLLGEIFEKTNGGAGTANFAVRDLIMLKFSDEDRLVDVETIEKTPKLATLKGTGATGGKYFVAKDLYDKHFFTYLSTFQAGEKTNIVYRYDDGKTNKVSVLSVTDSLIDYKGMVTVPIDEDKPAEVAGDKKSKKNSDKNIPVVTMDIDLDKQKDFNKHNSLLFMQENHALVQQYKDGVFTARIIGLHVR